MAMGRLCCRASADVSLFGSSNAEAERRFTQIVDICITNHYAAFVI